MALKILERDVIQANPLIRAKKEMNLTELRLFVLGLQDITPHITDDFVHDVDFHPTKISYSELVELFGADNNGNIANLKKQVRNAYNNTIELSYKDGGFGYRHIYRKMDYKPNEGLTILFDDEIKPYVLEIVNQAYTKYKVKAFFSLQSAYAWRLLESILESQGHFKKGHNKVYKILTVEEVRFQLNVPDGLYDGRMDNFKKKVLDDPIDDINRKTDYHVWYEVIKTGRKITGFKFWLEMKDKEKGKKKALPAPSEAPEQASEPHTEPIEKELENLGQTKLFTPPQTPEQEDAEKKSRELFFKHEILFAKMSPYFLNDKIEQLIIKYGAERVEANLKFAEAENKKSKKRSMTGWIISCIEQDNAARAEVVAENAKQSSMQSRIEQDQQLRIKLDRKFGLDDAEASNLIKKYGIDRLSRNADYLLSNHKTKEITKDLLERAIKSDFEAESHPSPQNRKSGEYHKTQRKRGAYSPYHYSAKEYQHIYV